MKWLKKFGILIVAILSLLLCLWLWFGPDDEKRVEVGVASIENPKCVTRKEWNSLLEELRDEHDLLTMCCDVGHSELWKKIASVRREITVSCDKE